MKNTEIKSKLVAGTQCLKPQKYLKVSYSHMPTSNFLILWIFTEISRSMFQHLLFKTSFVLPSVLLKTSGVTKKIVYNKTLRSGKKKKTFVVKNNSNTSKTCKTLGLQQSSFKVKNRFRIHVVVHHSPLLPLIPST